MSETVHIVGRVEVVDFPEGSSWDEKMNILRSLGHEIDYDGKYRSLRRDTGEEIDEQLANLHRQLRKTGM